MLFLPAVLLLMPGAQLWEREQPRALPEFRLESVTESRVVTEADFAGRRSLVFLLDGVEGEMIATLGGELREHFEILQTVGWQVSTFVCAERKEAESLLRTMRWPGQVIADPRGFISKYGRPDTGGSRHFWSIDREGEIEAQVYDETPYWGGSRLSRFLPDDDSFGNRELPGWFRYSFEGKLRQGRLIVFQGGGTWKLKATALTADQLEQLGPAYLVDYAGRRLSEAIALVPGEMSSVKLQRGFPIKLEFPNAPEALASSVALYPLPKDCRFLAEGHTVRYGIGWSYWIFEDGNLPLVLLQAKNLTATTGYWDHEGYSCIGSTFGYWIRHDDEGLNLEGSYDSGGFGCGVYSDGGISDEALAGLRFPPGASRYLDLTMGSEETIGRDKPYGTKLRAFGIAEGLTMPIKDVPYDWSDFGIDPNMNIICIWREGLGSSFEAIKDEWHSTEEESPPSSEDH